MSTGSVTREYAVERLTDVPKDVREKMRAALEKGIEMARKKFPPDDGIMNILFDEDYAGWMFQVSFFHDERMWPGPHVIVNAFREVGGDLVGRLAAKLEYTADDLRALDLKRLELLKTEKSQVEAEIEKLEGKLFARW